MPVTIPDVKPFIMRNAVVAFGGVDGFDFAKAVSSATLTPSSGTAEFKGLKPTSVSTFPQATTWTLDLSYAQDWQQAQSLSAYLYANRGKVLDFTLNPDDATGTTPAVGQTAWAGKVAITAGAVGGSVDEVATATVSLGVVGEPVPTHTAPALAGDDDDA